MSGHHHGPRHGGGYYGPPNHGDRRCPRRDDGRGFNGGGGGRGGNYRGEPEPRRQQNASYGNSDRGKCNNHRERGHHGGHNASGNGGRANNHASKRPAPVPSRPPTADVAASAASLPKRAKSSDASAVAPTGLDSAVAAACSTVSGDTVDPVLEGVCAPFILEETEEAYQEAFLDCLRQHNANTNEWKIPVHHISKQAFIPWERLDHHILQLEGEESSCRRAKHPMRKAWWEMKRAAVAKTLKRCEEVKSKEGPAGQRDGGNSSSEEEEDVPGGSAPPPPKHKLSAGERRFILALQCCVPLDAGFHILVENEHCYCPCGPHLAYWRKKHGLVVPCASETSAERTCEGRFEPSDLTNHLRRQGGMFEETERGKVVQRGLWDIYHYATRVYLGFLYADWHDKDFGHKGLYPKLSKPGYSKADRQEKRILQRTVDIVVRDNERQKEAQKRLTEQLAKEKKEVEFFRGLAKDHQQQVLDLEKVMNELGVASTTKEELSDRAVAKYERHLTAQFKERQRAAGVLTGDDKFAKSVQIRVQSEAGGSGFSLQQFFDDLYEKTTGDARAVMFADAKDDNKISKLILAEWKIVYDKIESIDGKCKSARDQKKEATAVDEGGPSRQFLTDVFKQVDTLSIQVGRTSIRLFETTPSGAVCTNDEDLMRRIKEAAKSCPKPQEETDRATKQARDYSRAIGRIIAHAICHDQTLPSNSMPNFVKTVMFHGYDEDYHRDECLNDMSKMGYAGEQTFAWILDKGKCPVTDEGDERGNKWTADSFFQVYIPKHYIRTRERLWSGLQDGLTLFRGGESGAAIDLIDGCGLSSIFSTVPIEAIERIYFARPSISLDDLLKVIMPSYGSGAPDPKLQMSEDAKKEVVKQQEIFFNGDFLRYLKESAEEDESFLAKFVECATGSNYLPYGGKSMITIEFNFGLDPLGFPKFHSCTSEIVLPGFELFFSDYETFKKVKMNDVINKVYNQFAMK